MPAIERLVQVLDSDFQSRELHVPTDHSDDIDGLQHVHRRRRREHAGELREPMLGRLSCRATRSPQWSPPTSSSSQSSRFGFKFQAAALDSSKMAHKEVVNYNEFRVSRWSTSPISISLGQFSLTSPSFVISSVIFPRDLSWDSGARLASLKSRTWPLRAWPVVSKCNKPHQLEWSARAAWTNSNESELVQGPRTAKGPIFVPFSFLASSSSSFFDIFVHLIYIWKYLEQVVSSLSSSSCKKSRKKDTSQICSTYLYISTFLPHSPPLSTYFLNIWINQRLLLLLLSVIQSSSSIQFSSIRVSQFSGKLLNKNQV